MKCEGCQNVDPEQFFWHCWKLNEWPGPKWGTATCLKCKVLNWFPPNADRNLPKAPPLPAPEVPTP